MESLQAWIRLRLGGMRPTLLLLPLYCPSKRMGFAPFVTVVEARYTVPIRSTQFLLGLEAA
jgi:hypothetical protein